MMQHAPSDYRCPFCALVRGEYNANNAADDIVFRDEQVLARVAPKWWPDNPGSVLVIPVQHHENLYDLPAELGSALAELTRRVAVAMRETYGCQGISTRQHNEPAGNQDVWHLHIHVLPRFVGDRLYQRHDEARWVSAEDRRPYAALLRGGF